MKISEFAKPLPNQLVSRYHGWRATTFSENESWYAHLAEHGQNPRAMVIGCCDSRLHVTRMFGADSGEVFVHRNIANLVPPYTEDSSLHGTSAAIEYGVTALHVANLIVIGHSNCGGVEGAYRICHEKEKLGTKFLEPWLNLLRPGYEALPDPGADRKSALKEMEKQSVKVSLHNLITFPFVKEAVKDRRLALHGLWHDIGKGQLHQYNGETDQFEVL